MSNSGASRSDFSQGASGSGSGVSPKLSVITGSGNFAVPSDVSCIDVMAMGGGAGGAGGGGGAATGATPGGGGGGQCGNTPAIAYVRMRVTPGEILVVTIGVGGAGGAGGAGGNNAVGADGVDGTDGGTTTIVGALQTVTVLGGKGTSTAIAVRVGRGGQGASGGSAGTITVHGASTWQAGEFGYAGEGTTGNGAGAGATNALGGGGGQGAGSSPTVRYGGNFYASIANVNPAGTVGGIAGDNTVVVVDQPGFGMYSAPSRGGNGGAGNGTNNGNNGANGVGRGAPGGGGGGGGGNAAGGIAGNGGNGGDGVSGIVILSYSST